MARLRARGYQTTLRPSSRCSGCAVSAAVQDVASTRSPDLAADVRQDFPVLEQEVHGKPLVYLDSAATSQKPIQVLDVIREFNVRDTANVHRGVHTLASRATDAYEGARRKVAAFINAPSDREIVWTKNATEAINLVAQCWAMHNLKDGDEVVISVAEHHANIVPWQMVCKATGATLKHIGLTTSQELDMDDLRSKVTGRTKLIALPHVSNVLGCVLPVDQVVEVAQQHGAKVLLDACQSVPHMPVDVQALGVDFIAASGHKMAGPAGVGFLWAKASILEAMPPWQFGGEMIDQVFLDHSTFAPPPLRFEPGTPAIEQVVGLGAAVDYLTSVGGMERVHQFEMDLGAYLYEELAAVEGVEVYGPPPDAALGRAGLAAFNIEGLHATDVSMLLDAAGADDLSAALCECDLDFLLRVCLHQYRGK